MQTGSFSEQKVLIFTILCKWKRAVLETIQYNCVRWTVDQNYILLLLEMLWIGGSAVKNIKLVMRVVLEKNQMEMLTLLVAKKRK